MGKQVERRLGTALVAHPAHGKQIPRIVPGRLSTSWITGHRGFAILALPPDGGSLSTDGRYHLLRHLTPEACLSQRSQWHVERVDETGRLIAQPHVALELLAERLDQACPETAPFGSMDRRAVPLGPCQEHALRLLVQCPGDVD